MEILCWALEKDLGTNEVDESWLQLFYCLD
jgi:hypothetical protein